MRRSSEISSLLRFAVLILFGTLMVIGVVWWLAQPDEPEAFYKAALDPYSAPGTLLKYEDYTRDVPADARGYRILYVTRRGDGRPAVGSAVVVAARVESAASRPVVAWAHGTVGIEAGCAPSMTKPFANVPALQELIAAGWVYVAPDYAGLGTEGGHAYLIGRDAALSLIDAVRGSRQLPQLNLAADTVVWGHSQGGNTALWTGLLAQGEGSNLNLRGVAALAPASDLVALVASSRATMFGKIVSAYLIHAYSRFYDDITFDEYVERPVRLVVDDLAGRCVGGWQTLVSAAGTVLLPRDGIFAANPASGPLAARLAENTPRGSFASTVFIAQGQDDDLVLPSIQERYVAAMTDAGNTITYRSYPGQDHISLVEVGSPLEADLMAWTRERFAPAP